MQNLWPEQSPRANFLTGTTVVELSTRTSGAYAGRLLYLLGADVVRVAVRSEIDCRADEYSRFEKSIHEGKRSLGVDANEEIARELMNCAIVIVDSLSDAVDPSVPQLFKGYVNLAGPGTAVVEIASDHVPTSLTDCAEGAMSWAIGSPDKSPLTLPFDVPDYLAGTEAAAAAALTLLTDSSGPWRVSGADVMGYYVGQISSNFIPYERPWHRDGARATMSGGSYPAAMFKCKDGWISVMCRTQVEWHGLVAALGHLEWLDDERYRDSRVVARYHADDLDPYVSAWCEIHTRQEVFAAGQLHGFPVAPVLRVDEALQEEQFRHRRFLVDGGDGFLSAGSPFSVTDGPIPDATNHTASRVTAQVGDGSVRPLNGLRVLDLSWVWSGPMVTAGLADLGAEVIKVENSRRPDPSRLRGRAFRDGAPVQGPELEVTPYFNQMNRGKQSIEIDMSSAQGAELIRNLARESDVVVENMRPGVLTRLGLDYAELSKDHPELVMLSLSMLGQTGPLSGIRGYAVVMSGLAGLDSIIGYDTDDLIGTFNPALGDPNGAAHGLVALLAALHRARTTGRGGWIDVSQVESILSVLRIPIIRTQQSADLVPPANSHSRWWPYGLFASRAEDSWIAVAIRSDDERTKLAELLGVPQPFERTDLEAALVRTASITDPDAMCKRLARAGLSASRVNTYDMLRDKSSVFTTIEHPWLGPQPLAGLPWSRGGVRFRPTGSAPQLGSSTTATLRRLLALDDAEIQSLRETGAIGGS